LSKLSKLSSIKSTKLRKNQDTCIENNEIKDSDSDVASAKDNKRFLPSINK